jgi:tRNA threonylcarbamoyladenosine biosynthesis protein TsaE
VTALTVVDATTDDAAELRQVIRRAFRARPTLDPPASATDVTEEEVRTQLSAHGGLIARHDGEPVGGMLFDRPDEQVLALRRVSVDPGYQGHGVASAMVGCAEDVAEVLGLDAVSLIARVELPDTGEFWRRRGYALVDRDGPFLTYGKMLPLSRELVTADDTRAFGRRLAALLRPGDLVVLAGDLGAGKTTLTQGIGAGLGVRGSVTSPTFVIQRVHPPLDSGPPLVHVDAYRVGDAIELDDLDIDASIEESVTVVEWGVGIAEELSDQRLEVRLDRAAEATGDVDPRIVTLRPYGARWFGLPLRSTLMHLTPKPQSQST